MWLGRKLSFSPLSGNSLLSHEPQSHGATKLLLRIFRQEEFKMALSHCRLLPAKRKASCLMRKYRIVFSKETLATQLINFLFHTHLSPAVHKCTSNIFARETKLVYFCTTLLPCSSL